MDLVATPPKPQDPALQCANPACSRSISSPRDGQTLEFEIISVSVAASDDDASHQWDESPKREARRVYLCSECARSVSIRIGPEGIRIIPANPAE